MNDDVAIVKYLTVDSKDNLLALANIESYMDQAYFLEDRNLFRLPEARAIHTAFAVDSKKNKFYSSPYGQFAHYVDYQTVAFPKETVEIKNVAVDKDDNVFYSDDKSLNVIKNGDYGNEMKILDIPKISRILIQKSGNIYLASSDIVYLLIKKLKIYFV